MTYQEKRAWIMLVVAVATYIAYAVIILGRAHGHRLTEVHYAATLLWTVGASILAAIVGGILFGGPLKARVTDVRDRQIGRLGEQVGQSFVIVGAVAALLMAMAGWHRFWIANVIYLAFVLSSVLGSVAKLVMYRRSVPQW